jgi:hypothetical protein
MKVRFAFIGLVLLSGLTPVQSRVTPEAARWHKDLLLGETADGYVVLRQERRYPGSYYEYSDELRVVRVAENNRAVMEEYVTQRSHCRQHPDTMIWHCSYDSLPPFDLSRHLRTRGVRAAYASDRAQGASIDSQGLYIEWEGIRATIMPMTAVLRQLPDLGEEPRVIGVMTTDRHEVFGGPLIYFFDVLSGFEAIDDNWSEDLLLVEEGDLQRAEQQLEDALKKKDE